MYIHIGMYICHIVSYKNNQLHIRTYVHAYYTLDIDVYLRTSYVLSYSLQVKVDNLHRNNYVHII